MLGSAVGDKCKFDHDPKAAPKPAKGAADALSATKGGGKASKGKVKDGHPDGSDSGSFPKGHIQRCSKFMKGKCEKGKECSFTHSKTDPSKGDLEVQRRVAEKKAKAASGGDRAGAVLGGDLPRIMLSAVEGSAGDGCEEWIWDTGAALDVANADVVGDKVLSFAPPILSAGGVVQSTESVVVPMPEIGDTVKAAVLPNTPNALSVGRRCAMQGYSFTWRPWQAKPEIWAPDGTEVECSTDEHFVPVIRRARPLKVVPVVEIGSDGAFAMDGHSGGDLGLAIEPVREVAGSSAEGRELLKDIERVVDDDDDIGHAEASDKIASNTAFSLKKDSVKYEDELYCTPFSGSHSVAHQALHLPRVRGWFLL